MFDMRCRENGIEHSFTKINHPWANGQVEHMNRTLKDATVKRFHYNSHEQLRHHLCNFIEVSNYALQRKILIGLTPYEFTWKRWTAEPDQIVISKIHQMSGLKSPHILALDDR